MIKLNNFDKSLIEENKEKYKLLTESKDQISVWAHWNAEYGASQTDSFENRECEYDSLIARHNMLYDAAKSGLDNIPSIAFDFGATAWLMNLAYGGQLMHVNGLINAKPVIDSYEKVYEIEKTNDIHNTDIYAKICERIVDFQQNISDEVLITISDNQSPIDVLTCILEAQDAMLGMYDSPDKIKYLLDIITDSIIEINLHEKKIIKYFGGYSSEGYLPYGMHVSDDNAAFLSPAIYKEFAIPYAERISETFGGISFHCCMGYEQNLSNMASCKGFLKFDPQVDFNNIDMIINAIKNSGGTWVVNNWPFQKNKHRDKSDEALFMEIIDMTENICSLKMDVFAPNKEEAVGMALRLKEYADKKNRLI